MTRAARRRWRIVIYVCGYSLGACAPDAPEGIPTEVPWVRGIRTTPSFRTDIQEIFTRRSCTTAGCHDASSPLPLTAGASYAALVRAPATAEPAIRVIPYDPVASYLLRRLEGTQAIGSRMPLGAAPLDSIDLANLRAWIRQGALPN